MMRRKKNGKQSVCKSCYREYQREWIAKDQMTRRAHHLVSRYRLFGHPITTAEMRERLSVLGLCPYCGEQLHVETVGLDHRIPRARGGSDELDNLQLVCMPCNAAKGNMSHENFVRLMALLQTDPELLVAVRTRLRASGLMYRRRGTAL